MFQIVHKGSLYLHDIQQCGPGDDTEPGVLERTVVPPWTNPTSFSWHPKHTNRLLGISQQGKNIFFLSNCNLKEIYHSFFSIGLTDYTVCERITLNWSTRSHLVWNHATKAFKYICSNDNIYKAIDDISILTKTRAMNEYGLIVNNYFKLNSIIQLIYY